MKDEKPINERLNVVEYFFRQPDFKELIEEQLHLVGDLERIISKVAVGRVSPREVVQLKWLCRLSNRSNRLVLKRIMQV